MGIGCSKALRFGNAMTHGQPPAPDAGDRQHRRHLFEQEVTRLLDRLYGTALRLTRDPHDAEDVVAEAVCKAWERLDDLRDLDRIEGWLFRILNNTFISIWRRRRQRRVAQADMERMTLDEADLAAFSLFQKLHQPFLLWWGTPQDQFLDRVVRDDIQRAIDDIPEEYRITFILVEVQGYSYEEAAEQLDLPLGTVRSRLSRGRSLLQKALWEQARDIGLVADGRRRQSMKGAVRP